MRQRPMAAAAVDPTMAQQKREQLLPLAAQIVRRRFPRPDEVADRLVDGIGHPLPVSSPARCSRASVTASRRLVLTRSPAASGSAPGRPPCSRGREPGSDDTTRTRSDPLQSRHAADHIGPPVS